MQQVILLNINSFGITPLMRYIVSFFSKNYDSVRLYESHINGSYDFTEYCDTKYIGRFQNSTNFNQQGKFYKIWKYIFSVAVIVKITLRNKETILYTNDYQILGISLLLNNIFNGKNIKIVYHQFELIEPRVFNQLDQKLYQLIKKYSKRIALVIAPEKNRLEIILDDLDLPNNLGILIPNTNEINFTNNLEKHKLFENIPSGKTIIGHIGSAGIDHHIINLLEVAKMLLNTNYHFLFVGKQQEESLNIINTYNLKNVTLVEELAHTELQNVYPFLDLGLILYKPIDNNFEFCAPNKLYEYWAYGVPVLSNNLKGLVSTYTHPSLGSFTDMANVEEFRNSIDKELKKLDKQEILNQFNKTKKLQVYLTQLKEKLND